MTKLEKLKAVIERANRAMTDAELETALKGVELTDVEQAGLRKIADEEVNVPPDLLTPDDAMVAFVSYRDVQEALRQLDVSALTDAALDEVMVALPVAHFVKNET